MFGFFFSFIENRLYDWDTVNWKQIESIFQGCEGHKLQQILLDLFTYYVPVILHCDFQGNVEVFNRNRREKSLANLLGTTLTSTFRFHHPIRKLLKLSTNYLA